jgi:hypothetical protein
MGDTRCDDCGSTDLDDRGNCWACLGRKGDAQATGTAKPAPVAASEEVEVTWKACVEVIDTAFAAISGTPGEYPEWWACDAGGDGYTFTSVQLDAAVRSYGDARAAAEKGRADQLQESAGRWRDKYAEYCASYRDADKRANAEKTRADANEKALRGLLDGIDVCHVCGTALVADSDSIGSRCDEHANADEGSEDEDAEPWYMPAQEWRKRVARARALLGLDKEPHG